MDIDLTNFSDPAKVKTIRLHFRGLCIAEIAIYPEQSKKIDTAFIPEEVWINGVLHNNLVKDGCIKLV